MPSSKVAKSTRGSTDWAALRVMSEAEIERLAGEDDVNPSSDDGHWAQAVAGLPADKTSIHASFDRDVVEFFKRDGHGYQARMNDVLRRHMEAEKAKTQAR